MSLRFCQFLTEGIAQLSYLVGSRARQKRLPLEADAKTRHSTAADMGVPVTLQPVIMVSEQEDGAEGSASVPQVFGSDPVE